jgi:hypothetical protein
MYLWNFIDQSMLTSAIDLRTQDFYTTPATVLNTMNGLTGARVPLYTVHPTAPERTRSELPLRRTVARAGITS